jgi:hypothetical protein
MTAQKKKVARKVAPKPAVTTHGVDHGHESRVDETSEYDATHQQEAAGWLRPSSLDAPPCRDGMTQRWVRKSIHGADDPKNLNRSWREGWRPRSPDSLTEEWRIYASFADKENGMIVVDDLILMEIDSSVLKKRKLAIQRATASQMQSVEHDLESSQIAGHPIVKEHSTSVTHPSVRVQPAKVADDD